MFWRDRVEAIKVSQEIAQNIKKEFKSGLQASGKWGRERGEGGRVEK